MLLLWFFPLVVSYRIKVNASYSIKKTSICAVIFSHTSNHNSCNVCQYIDILTSDLSVQITTLIYNSTILWSFVTVSFMVVILPQWQSDRHTNTLLSTHSVVVPATKGATRTTNVGRGHNVGWSMPLLQVAMLQHWQKCAHRQTYNHTTLNHLCGSSGYNPGPCSAMMTHIRITFCKQTPLRMHWQYENNTCQNNKKMAQKLKLLCKQGSGGDWPGL